MVRRYIPLLIALLTALLLAVPAWAEAESKPSPPPGVIRWDIAPEHLPEVATPGPAPTACKLGAPLSQPYTLDVDEYGRIYILDYGRSCLMRFVRDGSLEKLWPDGLDDFEPMGREDMCVIRDETVYLAPAAWLGWLNVRRIRPGDAGEVSFPVECAQAASITARDDGTYCMWAYEPDIRTPGKELDCFFYLYSPHGKEKTRWKARRIQDIDYGPGDLIYATQDAYVVGYPRILVYTEQGKLVREVNLESCVEENMVGSISVDRNGDTYLGGRYILRLNSKGQPVARWRPYRPQGSADSSSFPRIAVRDGLVYALVATSSGMREIQVFTPNGQCVTRYLWSAPELDLPGLLAVQSDGSYAVVRQSNKDSLLIFDASGNRSAEHKIDYNSISAVLPCPTGGYYVSTHSELLQIGDRGESVRRVYTARGDPRDTKYEDTAFQMALNPATMDIWGLGCSGIVTVRAPDGSLIKSFGENRELNLPTFSQGLAFDPQGFLYVPDTRRHRILKCDSSAKVIAKLGKKGSGLGELLYPQGLLVDSEGRLFVADTGNSRIQVFSREGKPLGVWGRYGKGGGTDELDRPLCIAFGPGDTLYISDTHNDRIVKVPLSRFWSELVNEPKPEPVAKAPKKEPIPLPGEVTIQGIVTAGTDDFTDSAYIETQDRAWGMRVTLPADMPAYRGDNCKATGTLELKERAAKHLKAKKVERLSMNELVPEPLGMANLYVGDGYRKGAKSVDLSNLGLLVRTWGKVISVDTQGKFVLINDGSFTGEGEGLEVYAGQLKNPFESWPKVGQYIMVTGISVCRPVGDGTFRSAIRVRGQDDIEVLAEQGEIPEAAGEPGR